MESKSVYNIKYINNDRDINMPKFFSEPKGLKEIKKEFKKLSTILNNMYPNINHSNTSKNEIKLCVNNNSVELSIYKVK